MSNTKFLWRKGSLYLRQMSLFQKISELSVLTNLELSKICQNLGIKLKKLWQFFLVESSKFEVAACRNDAHYGLMWLDNRPSTSAREHELWVAVSRGSSFVMQTFKYSWLRRLDVPRCNVSYRLIGGRVSPYRAPLTFSRLTVEVTCYICLRLPGCAGNSSSQRRLVPLPHPSFWEGTVTDLAAR